MNTKICCLITSETFRNKTINLAKRLRLPVFTALPQKQIDFWLYFTDQGLCLKHIHTIHVDFTNSKTNYRRLYGGGRNQAIAKAIGPKYDKNTSILDATAGLGQDAFILASLGYTITLIEQSPIIAALLEDGLKRAQDHPKISQIIQRMHFTHTNSITYMQQLSINRPDIVYLDPMFPDRKKSALPRKEMQVLKTLLFEKIDEADLFNTALNCAQRRVVVKRPRLTCPINHQKPTFIIPGKSCRFDVYVSKYRNHFYRAYV
jgi:16S rRNA (guanine1516-N2)-methyltransferase